MGDFKSYIGDSEEFHSITLNESQKTKFLYGETLVFEANKVTMFVPLSDRKKEINGVLSVTTFKMSFVSAEDQHQEMMCQQQNHLLGYNDVCLSQIDGIYQIADRSKKRLVPGHSVTGKVKDLLVVCKNMRSFEFSFKHGDKDNGKNVANALLHHAYPKRHSLLFAYDFKETYIESNLMRHVRQFLQTSDWKRELERTKCQNWRISYVNQNYQISPVLMEALIVPNSVMDNLIREAVEHFRYRCCPVWVWGKEDSGVALVRMADLLPTLTDRMQENVLLEHIRKSHPDKQPPIILDLSIPTPKEVQNSFVKLRELCTPESTKQFKSQDIKFYSLLDQTKWLHWVGLCLSRAHEAASRIFYDNSTVVLQEGNGQDLNCVVSSLTQLLLDPFFRTLNGFQSLIQKDWVAMGHPFAHRLGHIIDKEIEPAPILLLFLDSVWQLVQQFPLEFQITETYLTTLWDSAHVSVFDTFLFNSVHQRCTAKTQDNTPITLRPVWDWREQFADKDITLFYNPLFVQTNKKTPLKPHCGLAGLEVWTQCYFRWMPDLEIRNGGKTQVDLTSRKLCGEICNLQKINGTANNSNNIKQDSMDLLHKINSFYPFSSSNNQQINDFLPINSMLLTADMFDSQSILNLND